MSSLIRAVRKCAEFFMRQSFWKKIVMVLSCFVVFGTTYMLILPAITLEKTEAQAEAGIDIPVQQLYETAAEIDVEEQYLSGPQTFEGADYTVTVEVPETARIPMDAVLAVDEVTDEEYKIYCAQAAKTLGAETVPFARFFDIRFEQETEEGRVEVKPMDSVTVTIDTGRQVENGENAAVLHYKNAGETSELTAMLAERLTDEEVGNLLGDGLTREELETFASEKLTQEESAEIIAGIDKSIESVEAAASQEEYDEFSEQNTEEQDSTEYVDGGETEFLVDSSSSIIVDDADSEADVTEDVDASAETEEQYETEEFDSEEGIVYDRVLYEAPEMLHTENAAAEVTFSTDGFSVFGVVYTVDFEYTDPLSGETFSFSLDGGESVSLTDLIVAIGIESEENAADFVANQVENVEFSNTELIRISHDGDVIDEFGRQDWILESLQSFETEETLTITLVNGEQIVVKVTDPPTSDIASLLTNVTVTGAQEQSPGTYLVQPGTSYAIHLDFAENDTTTFMRIGRLHYQLPAGIVITSEVRGTIVPADSHLAEIYTIDYVVGTNGQVTFEWKVKPGKQAEFEALEGGVIGFDLNAQFDENASQVNWGGQGTYVIDQTKDINITSKNAYYNNEDGKVHYTITVTSKGTNTNVVLKDTFVSGAAVTLDTQSMHETGSGSHNISYTNVSGSGFTATIPKMTNGETVTIEYTASVDYNALIRKEGKQNSYGTFDTTGNTVVFQGHDDNPSNNSKEGYVNHQITYSSAVKKASGGAFENGKRTMNWQITANGEHKATISYISDAMKTGSDKMEYSGGGITVDVYDANGEYVDSYSRTWGELGVNSNSKSWRHNIPNEYKGQGYSYVVKYSTAVNVGDSTSGIPVSNETETDYGKGTGNGTAEPRPGQKFDFEKKVNKLDLPNGTVTWDIPIDVPETGLDELVVYDYLPRVEGSLGTFFDTYVSHSVTNLIDGEEVHKTEQKVTKSIEGGDVEFTDAVVFTFTKGEESGLYPVAGGRKIVLQVVTKLNEEWLAADPGDDSNLQNYLTHTNLAKINNVDKRASVTIDDKEPLTQKTIMSDMSGRFHWHGDYASSNNLDGWGYRIFLYGLNDETIDGDYLVVTDTFDNRYLAFDQNYYGQWDEAQANGSEVSVNDSNIENWHRKFTYADHVGQSHYLGLQDIEARVSGNTITFRIPKSAIPKDDMGNYWPEYHISYFLRVKDPDTVALIKEDAIKAGGVLKIGNTAYWAAAEPSSTEVRYEVPVIDKSHVTLGDPKTGNYQFELKINESAQRLGTEEYLTVKDTVTNLTVDYSSLEFIPEDAVVAYDHSGNTLTFTVKNETAVTIRYKASALASGDYKNVMEMNGEVKVDQGTADISARGTSSFNVPLHIKILKHVQGNMLDVLPNVHFIIYEYSETAANHYGTKLGEYTTRADGTFEVEVPHLSGNNNLSKKYILHEVEPPTGFERMPHDYEFTVSKETANYGQWIYINNDTLPVANTPTPEDELTISVEKTWAGNAVDEQLPDVTVHLYAKDEKLAGQSTGVEVDSYTLTSADLDQTTGKWVHSFTGLDADKTYFIKEDPVPGYIATYTNANTLGLDRSGTIGVTNTKQRMHVEKVWDGGNAPQSINGLNIHVLKDGVNFKDYTIYPNSSTGKWELDIEDLVYPGNYTIEEDHVSGWTLQSVVYTKGGEPVTALTGTGTAVITNQPDTTPEDTTLNVEKKWYGDDGTTELTEEERRLLSATVELVRYRKEINGTELHFFDFGTKKEIASTFVKKNGPIQFHVDQIDNATNAKFTAYDPANISDYNAIESDASISAAAYMSTPWNVDFTIQNPGLTDIYAVLWSCPGISISVLPTSQPEASTGESQIDPDYTNRARITLNYANNWQASFVNQPTVGTGTDGKKYTYTYGLREVSCSGGFEIAGYSSSGTPIAMSTEEGYEDATVELNKGTSVTVGNKVKTKDVEITKHWEGLDNVTVYNHDGGNQPILQNNLRIYVELQRFFPDGTLDTSFDGSQYIGSMYGYSRPEIGVNGHEIGHETTEATPETSTDTWKAVWEQLPAAGKNSSNEYVEYTYKVKETNVVLSNAVDSSDPFVVANGNVNSSIGGENQRSVKTLFTSTVTNDGTTIVNTFTPTSIRVNKVWKNGEEINWPDDIQSVTVQLFAQRQGGEKVAIKKDAGTYWTLDITKNSRQSERTFENLPAKDTEGNDITYTVEEIKMTKADGTVVELSDGMIGEWSVTNGEVTGGVATVTNEKLKNFEFTKIWKTVEDEIEESWPEGKTITILLGTQKGGVEEFVLDSSGGSKDSYTWTATKNDDDNTYTFKIKGLPAIDTASGEELVYYVKEVPVDGYKEPEYGMAQTVTGEGGVQTTTVVSKPDNTDRAFDKQYITNRPESAVSLPSTGGRGTLGIYLAGVTMLLSAGLLYLMSRFRRLA